MQGVTTSVVGNCGLSMAPVDPERADLTRHYLAPFLRKEGQYSWKWRTLEEFFQETARCGIAQNLAPLVGQGTIRIAVKGFDEGPSTREEMDRMKNLLAQSLDEGAFGLTSGLIYPPGCYADAGELTELASVLKTHGGFYATHMRNEGDRLLESVAETLALGEANGIPVHVSHHKAFGRANWGKVKESLALMEAARERGVEVNCDVYPYLAGMTTLTSLLPPSALEGGVEQMLLRLSDPEDSRKIEIEIEQGIPGWENWIQSLGWENIVISECEKKKEVEGLSLKEIAGRNGVAPCEALFGLLRETRGTATMLLFGVSEEDLRTVVKNPLSCIASDSWVVAPRGGGKPHPRAYGTFPRFLKTFVRDKGDLTWEDAIRKITSLPATKAGIAGRGLVKEGFWADLVLFDPRTIRDRATFADPHQFPEGITHVIVNGEPIVEGGQPTGRRPGKVLKRHQQA
jgi:N-acyl-D-amino-acid deacylase